MDTPLLLEEYFFPHVKVSADPEASEEKTIMLWNSGPRSMS